MRHVKDAKIKEEIELQHLLCYNHFVKTIYSDSKEHSALIGKR